MVNKESCPLCQSLGISFYGKGENRVYCHCENCDLVYVLSEYFLTKEDEKAKYDNHENSFQDEGYKEFLNRLLTPLCQRLPLDAKGLDFGSGPGPTLSLMMKDLGYDMEIYDYFYKDEKEVFEKSYDFITTTEVIEHLHNPLFEIQKLWDCLKLGGYLGIMTAFRPNLNEFENWYYKRDLTHVRFFTKKTFEWLAKKLDGELFVPRSGVVILKKRDIK